MRDERMTRYLDVAHRIGRRLVRDATWDGDLLRWEVSRRDVSAAGDVTHARVAAGPWLYSGTSGIAFALAELATRTGDEELLTAAHGTWRHALTTPPAPAFAFHTGEIGRVWVAHRLAELLKDDEYLSHAAGLLARAREGLRTDTALDVISGSAGAIPALLSMHRAGHLAGVLDLAVDAGEHLIRQAVRRGYGWSWRGFEDSLQHLCGYAHGASGFVHAFLELYAVTGDPRWRRAALRGLEYERHHRLPDSGDWPDYRCFELGELRAREGGMELARQRLADASDPIRPEARSVRAWCHGAPGVALVRARACALGIDCREELVATVRATFDSLIGGTGNPSLCHGLLGNAEVLLHLPQDLQDAHRAFVLRCIDATIDACGGGDRPWPTGAHQRVPDPSLLLGEAGQLLGLLRFAAPETPSVTFVTADGTLRPRGRVVDPLPAASLREELRVLLPRVAQVAAVDRDAAARFDATVAGLDGDRDIADLLREIDGHLEELVPHHALAIAWAQDHGVLAADAAFTNYVEQMGILARAAALPPLGLDEPMELAPTSALLPGTDDADDPRGVKLPALVIARGERAVRTIPLSDLQWAALQLLRAPATVRELSAQLMADSEDAGVEAEAFEAAMLAFADTFMRLGVLRQAAAVGV